VGCSGRAIGRGYVVRRLRARWRLQTAMIAVALAALALAALARPYPVMCGFFGGTNKLTWSDGQDSYVPPGRPLPAGRLDYGVLVGVRWTDGRTTWHLRRTPSPAEAPRPRAVSPSGRVP
jgi:hypothetical protein